MTDDNVLRPAFGQRKSNASTTTASAKAPRQQLPDDESADDFKNMKLEGDARMRAAKDLAYMIGNQDYVSAMRDKLGLAGDVIFSLKNFNPHDGSIKLRRAGLKTLSLEDVCRLADDSTELQWRSQPSYIGALTLEHHYRIQAALSLMNPADAPADTK